MTNQNEVKWTIPKSIPSEIEDELNELVEIDGDIFEFARHYVNLFPTNLERAMDRFCQDICDSFGASEFNAYQLAEIIRKVAVREEGNSDSVNRPIIYSYDRSQIPEFSGKKRVTRSQAENIARDRIREMLDECAKTQERENKILVTKKLMDFLVTEAKGCMFNNFKFRETVKDKMIEFSQKNNLFFPDHYWLLFHEVLPGYDELLEEYRNSLHLINWRS